MCNICHFYVHLRIHFNELVYLKIFQHSFFMLWISAWKICSKADGLSIFKPIIDCPHSTLTIDYFSVFFCVMFGFTFTLTTQRLVKNKKSDSYANYIDGPYQSRYKISFHLDRLTVHTVRMIFVGTNGHTR